MKRFSTISMRPIPCLRPNEFKTKNISTGSVCVAEPTVTLTGRPALNSTEIHSGVAGAPSSEEVSFHISTGGVVFGSSKIPASYEM